MVKFAVVLCAVLAVAHCDVSLLQAANLPLIPSFVAAGPSVLTDEVTTPEALLAETTVPNLLTAASSVSVRSSVGGELVNEYLPPDNEYLPPTAEEVYVPPQARNAINEVDFVALNTNSIQSQARPTFITRTIPGAFGKDQIVLTHSQKVPQKIEIVPSSGYFYPQPRALFLLRK